MAAIDYRTHVFALFAGLLGLLTAVGCSGPPRLSSMEAGKTQSYAPGVPNFDMEAIATRRNNRAGVDLYLGVPYRSFAFEKDTSGFYTPYEFQVEIREPENEELIETRSWVDTVRVSNQEATQRYHPLSTKRRFDLENGDYLFRVVLEDLNSEQRAVRSAQVEVPDFSTGEPKLSDLFISGKPVGDSLDPIVALHIPGDVDSLRTMVELYDVGAARRVDIESHFVRFRSDHSIAQPPDGITPMSGSLEYRGTEYDEVDTVQTQQYVLDNPGDSLLVVFNQPPVEPGMYRVVLDARIEPMSDTTESVTFRRERTLSIKSPAFPEITSLNEMIEALTYVARDREIEEIQNKKTVEERRESFDAFWGEIAENREEASHLIETYYGRVEDANRFFTSHKEGWKTDRGMIYIMYGPPLRVERYVNEEIWYYGYSAQDPRDQYVFTRGRRYDRDGPLFNNFLLERRPYYRRDWDRAVRRWRNGEVPRGG